MKNINIWTHIYDNKESVCLHAFSGEFDEIPENPEILWILRLIFFITISFLKRKKISDGMYGRSCENNNNNVFSQELHAHIQFYNYDDPLKKTGKICYYFYIRKKI